MKKIFRQTLFVLAGLLLVSSQAMAANTAPLAVGAQVADNCLITTSPINFGSYDYVDTNNVDPLVGTGTVTVTCTDGAIASVTLGFGNNDGGLLLLRKMASGANLLSYKLYSDSGRLAEWASETFTANGLSNGLTVYGSVLGGQNVPAGSYVDTVVATVTF